MTRKAFEAFISAPPFEMPIERFDDRGAWPGGYTELEVDLAWQAWQAATNAARELAPATAPEELERLRQIAHLIGTLGFTGAEAKE